MANKKLTPEQKADIIRLRFEEGMTVTAIAAKYGICKSTAFNVISEYKKHGYTLPESEPETAYATEAKEPASAATETSSEQGSCKDDPENIIPQEAENVKCEMLPEAVVRAAVDAVRMLNRRIAEIDKKAEGFLKARSQLIELKGRLTKDCAQICNYLIKQGYEDVLMVLENKEDD